MGKITIPYRPRKGQLEIHDGMEGKRFGVIVAHRRFGKTVAAINDLIKKALKCKNERPHFGYCAPYRNQAESIAWDYLKYFTSPLPNVKRNESKLSITLPNGAVIRLFGADNADAMRGLYFDGIILDEIAQFKPDVWPEIIRPALTDRKGWAIFIGTPKGINQFYELYQLAIHDDDWYAGCFRADETGVLPGEELKLAKNTMSDSAYRQEFLCDFTASSDNMFIPIDLVSEASGKVIHPDVYHRAPKILGVDVARFGDDKSVIIKRQGLAVVWMKKYQDIDLMMLSALVGQEVDDWEPDGVFVDSVGMGAGVVDRLTQLGYSIVGVNAGTRAANGGVYYNKRAEMWGIMRDWLKDGGAIPDDIQLKEDLMAPTYKYHADNSIKLEKKEDMKARGLHSPDCADALALTFAHPVKAKHDRAYEILHSVQEEYDPLTYRVA